MKKLLLFCFFFSFSLVLFSQTKYEILKNKILKADNVIVIQCQNKQGRLVIDSSFLANANDSIIFKKGKVLTVRQKKQLANVIAKPDFPKGKFGVIHPYSPEQIILLIHKGNRSFIQMGSRKIIQSLDFRVLPFTIDIQKEIAFDNFLYDVGIERHN